MFRVLIKPLTNDIFVTPIIFLYFWHTHYIFYTYTYTVFYIIMQTSLVYVPHTNNWREFTNMAGRA